MYMSTIRHISKPIFFSLDNVILQNSVYLEPGSQAAVKLGMGAVVQLDCPQVVQVGLTELVLLLPPLTLHTVPSGQTITIIR